MKILMTADTIGGVWTYALSLCRALEPVGVEVTLATMGAPLSPAQRMDVRGCRNVAVHESAWRLEWMPEPWDDVAAAGRWLLELESSAAPDVVHLNGYAHGVLPWRAPVLVVGHSCVLSWWQAVHGGPPPREWDRYRDAVTEGLRGAQVVIAPTRSMLESLRAHYGPLPDTRVVPNGCDGTLLPIGARDAFGRYGRHDTLPESVVLAAGRVWDESKNFATLATAAPHIEWPVYVAGSNAGPGGARSALPHVHCLGPLPAGAMAAWYRRASIFVHPALYEPFGLAPLEAALAGSALVLADIPSLRELWQDAAVFVPPRDSRAIAGAVNELAAEPLRLASAAAAARTRAATLSARTMARAYHRLYRELVEHATAEALACAS
jgi:glycogen synthase